MWKKILRLLFLSSSLSLSLYTHARTHTHTYKARSTKGTLVSSGLDLEHLECCTSGGRPTCGAGALVPGCNTRHLTGNRRPLLADLQGRSEAARQLGMDVRQIGFQSRSTILVLLSDCPKNWETLLWQSVIHESETVTACFTYRKAHASLMLSTSAQWSTHETIAPLFCSVT